MATSEQLNELAAALVEAQGEFPSIRKTEEGKIKGTTKTGSSYEYSYSYADLATVVETVQPTLTKAGLAISQFVTGDGVKHYLTTYLFHKSGQYIAHDMELLLSKVDAQGQGSAITYARRYSYMAVLGLVADEDDDGNAASTANPALKPKAAYPSRKPVEAPVEPVDTETGEINPTITTEQVAELLSLAKAKGKHTKDEAVDWLNAMNLGDFTKLPAREFAAFKKLIISDGWPNNAS